MRRNVFIRAVFVSIVAAGVWLLSPARLAFSTLLNHPPGTLKIGTNTRIDRFLAYNLLEV